MSPAKSPSSEYQNIVNGHSQSIGLITQELQFMRQGIDGIKDSIDSLKKEIMDGFVTKDQYRFLEREVLDVKEEIKNIHNTKNWVIGIVGSAIILSLLASIGLRV